jgi:3-dehydroquinate synthetase/shikimate kinase
MGYGMNMFYLYGAPASGKTTLGRELAQKTGRPFVDLDGLIVQREARSIAEMFKTEGEAYFRKVESAVLRAVDMPGAVVALGGGTLLDPANRAFCESQGTVVCLDAPAPDELSRRIALGGAIRPLGDCAEERAAHYASFSNRIVKVFALSGSMVAVGNGFARALTCAMPRVVDGNLAALHNLASGPETIAVIPSGEEHKTPATVMRLWSAFARCGLGRKDAVAAFGGGVTGDLTGFAAATWMRGMDWVNVPTTLLAMVDASTGGKTGCDLPEGKNLAGSFHFPRLVAVDADWLTTLPAEILRDGHAEMIKHEIISGAVRDGARSIPTPAEIAGSLAVKISVVERDPFEKTGERMKLNCGHTVAHAVETLSGYRISHGEAVAIGCTAEARLAAKLGLTRASWPQELSERFLSFGLPVELPSGMTWARMREVIMRDKKRSNGTVAFALPCGWGDVRLVQIDPLKEFADEN